MDYEQLNYQELQTIRGQVVEINGNLIDMTTEVEKVNMILESGDRRLEKIDNGVTIIATNTLMLVIVAVTIVLMKFIERCFR